jgi:hypothetical protein
VEGFQARPFGCELGSQFHRGSRFQPPSLKFRTAGFPQYGFKHQAPVKFSGRLPDPVHDSSPIPTSVVHPASLHLPLGPPRSRVLIRLGVRTLRSKRARLGPEVLAPARLCCPRLLRLPTSSASLETSVSFPKTLGYRGGLWHSRILLPGFQTFRAFTDGPSRIAASASAGRSPMHFPVARIRALAIG